MSEILTFGFKTMQNPNASQFGFQRVRILDIRDFVGHTKRLDFSEFGFQTVSEVRTFGRVPLASKWLATVFLYCFNTPTFSLTE